MTKTTTPKPKAQWSAHDWWESFMAHKRKPKVEDFSDFVRANAAYIAPRCVPESPSNVKPLSWGRVALHEPSGRPDTIGPRRITLSVGLDYVGLGQDHSYLRTPITPQCAQQIADHFGCVLPTPAIVDAIVEDAQTRLPAHPQDRGLWNVWLANVMSENDAAEENVTDHMLVTGHRKDVVLSDALPHSKDAAYGVPNPVRTRNVAIYGWHGARGPNPLQPLYAKHAAGYLDYSHGVRLVSRKCLVHGHQWRDADVERDLLDVMSDPLLGPLVCGADYPLAFREYPMLGGEKPLNFAP